MANELKLAVAQICSADHHDENIDTVVGMIREAAENGAELVCFPEVAGLMNRNRAAAKEMIRAEPEDPYVQACQSAAAQCKIWVHTGSTPTLAPDGERFLNTSHLLDSDGNVVARYNKIHLFDVDLPDGTRIRESSRYAPGAQAVLADTPWGPWGMTVCYDLRFPQLYRDYGLAGATMMFVPSAFAVKTGQAHWEPLLKARAIENGCFIVASAQAGKHVGGGTSYGHAMVVDPWGEVTVDMADVLGLHYVTLDLDAVTRTREMIPSLANGRDYSPI
ncbi:MAG: carbon-nitrogen hydrolase family protein [Chromatiales bacterium]|jgi:deaminated glutathione amidase|nr:carbon-nitrogen hydrolase family protein [Chromatiales bacterium]